MKKAIAFMALTVSLFAGAFGQSYRSIPSSAAGEGASERGYRTDRGDNELGGTVEGSYSATNTFGGLKKEEARDRKSFMLVFRYGRTLAANSSLALQYTLDAIPLALQTGNITEVQTTNTPSGAVTTFHRGTSYGAGLTPLGLQLNFRNRSRIKPFLNVGAGGMIFSKPVPLPDAGRFAFTLQGVGGVRILDTSRRSLSVGLKLYHVSNGNLSGSNRGLNQFAVSLGYSIFK